MAGTKVRVFNEKHSFEVLTDKNGVYEIWDIPLGKYQVQAVTPQGMKQSFIMEKGLVDFDTLKNPDAPDDSPVLIEIEPRGCGGIDFILHKQTEVMVLLTLHQFHGESRYYSFADLYEIIKLLKPDVLAVELTPADLESCREQKVKQEY